MSHLKVTQTIANTVLDKSLNSKSGNNMGLWLRTYLFFMERSKALFTGYNGKAALLYGLMAVTMSSAVWADTDTSTFGDLPDLTQCSEKSLAELKKWASENDMREHRSLILNLCSVYDATDEFYSNLAGDDGSILPDVVETYIGKLRSLFAQISGWVESFFIQITDILSGSTR